MNNKQKLAFTAGMNMLHLILKICVMGFQANMDESQKDYFISHVNNLIDDMQINKMMEEVLHD